MTKKELLEAATVQNKQHMREWLEAAREHGTIYYIVEKVSASGMIRYITLYTMRERGQWDPPGAKASMDLAWPNMNDIGTTIENSHEAWCHVAKTMHFDPDHRAFKMTGCGMDMVFALIEDLVRYAGIEESLAYTSSVRCENLSRYEGRR